LEEEDSRVTYYVISTRPLDTYRQPLYSPELPYYGGGGGGGGGFLDKQRMNVEEEEEEGLLTNNE